ncbi:MAG: lipid II flippase MurJ, partial [Chloroflexota bacterium]
MTDDAATPPDAPEPWTRLLPAPLRRVVARFFPQGAILLAVVTFGSYGLGFVRDIVQARTFGAGAELDAYNAAFAIPEIALGVLVASGLSAPFVPIFLALRGEHEQAANDFAGTVMTLAVLIIGVATPILFVIAPLTVDVVGPGFNADQRALYVDLFRLMLVTPVLFAVSDV